MKKVLPILISVIVLVTNILAANAAENMLSGVNIKGGANSYTVELTTSTPAKMSKTIISANRILINLDNVKAINNITTKYDKNAVMDTVIVEPQGKNVSIMLQGDNIAYSDIVFKEPTSIQQIQDNIVDTVAEAGMSIIDFSTNKTVPCVLLLVLVGVLLAEVRFIKARYSELNHEKSLLEKDIERTSDFKEYTMGYGSQGIKKPYTTPIYSNPKDTSLVRANYLKRLQTLKTDEIVTLNSLLSNHGEETQIINKIVNPKPVFGSLSNLKVEPNKTISNQTVTSPVSKSQLKSQLQHLETLSKLYQQSNDVEHTEETFQRRLNGLY